MKPLQKLKETFAPNPAFATPIKTSFVTRRVNLEDCHDLITDRPPAAGDLVLARVERVAQHTRVQLDSGRRSQLYVGDRLLLSYGNRYAPDQFGAEVPSDLSACHLITAGGVAGRMVTKHSSLKNPTLIQPEGLVGDSQGRVINLRRYGMPVASLGATMAKPVIGVLGTAMNAGKTTAAASLVRGFAAAGLKVAAIKATGTGSGNDVWALEDAGAHLVLDFADMGYPSTFKVPADEIEVLYTRLLTAAFQSDVDVVIAEVADGLLHAETAELVCCDRYRESLAGIVFCAGDALGAQAGVEWLEMRGLPVVGISGAFTASRLAMKEAARATLLPVLTRECLSDARVVGLLSAA